MASGSSGCECLASNLLGPDARGSEAGEHVGETVAGREDMHRMPGAEGFGMLFDHALFGVQGEPPPQGLGLPLGDLAGQAGQADACPGCGRCTRVTHVFQPQSVEVVGRPDGDAASAAAVRVEPGPFEGGRDVEAHPTEERQERLLDEGKRRRERVVCAALQH